MLRKHILSQYSEQINTPFIVDKEKMIVDTTYETRSLENSDADQFCEGTAVTETIENSDPDEFVIFDSTKMTFSMENSDSDEFRIN